MLLLSPLGAVWGSEAALFSLLTADCGGENLVFQLQLPVPVLKSAFVLPAYSQGNRGHLEMFLWSKRPDFSHLERKGFIFQCMVRNCFETAENKVLLRQFSSVLGRELVLLFSLFSFPGNLVPQQN